MSGVRSRARRADVVRSDRGHTPVQSPQDSGRAQKRGHRPGHDDRAKVVATHVTREVGPPPFQLSPCQKIRKVCLMKVEACVSCNVISYILRRS